MNCYLCLIEPGSATRSAVAICQHCGAGMCEIHLVASQRQPFVSQAGMAGAFPTRGLMCSQCYGCAFPSSRLHKPIQPEKRQDEKEKGSRGRWWRWLRRHHSTQSLELPRSEEAVALVEDYLKRQRGG